MILGSGHARRAHAPVGPSRSPSSTSEWMAHLRRQVVSRRTIIRGAVGAAAGSLLLGRRRAGPTRPSRRSSPAPGRSRAVSSSTAATCRSATTRAARCGSAASCSTSHLQRGAAALGAGLARVRRGPLLRARGRGGDPRAAHPRAGLGRQAGRAQGVPDAQRGPVLRARAPVRPGARHRVPLPVPVRRRPRDAARPPTPRS